jgi:ribose transport system ATP-binding protein
MEPDFRPESEVVLQAINIVKEFSGVRVLDNVNFTLRKGEVHALLGENGAGKSTLMKILAGVYQQTSGKLILNDNNVEFKNRHDADAAGIGIVYQEFSQVPQMSIVENLFLGKEIYKSVCGGVINRLDKEEMKKRAVGVVDKFGIKLHMNMPVKELGVANQQLIEICKALFNNAKILILDEPTAALSEGESESLFKIIKELKEQGVSIIYISHRLEEISRVCDRATIIRDGKNVETIGIKERSIEEIISLMIGKEIKNVYPKKNQNIGKILLELEKLSSPNRFNDVSFSVREGEIVGITGLVGAGKTEIVKAIFGLDKKVMGKIITKNGKISIKTPTEARMLGIAMIPEDRKRHGVILRHSATDNISLPNLKLCKTKINTINFKKIRSNTSEVMKHLDIRPLAVDKLLHYFSGGNQQKIVIAKWLKADAKVFIFDEPTRGVDVGAKTEIYKLIAQLATSGCGIILCSSEIEEIIGLSNKIIVMKKGRIVTMTDDSANDIDITLKAQLGG